MLRRISYILGCLSLSLGLIVTAQTAQGQQFFVPQMDTLTATAGLQYFGPTAGLEADITRDDVIAAARKWETARPSLNQFWEAIFANAGRNFSGGRGPRYVAPQVAYCASASDQLCEKALSEGPFYSPRNHTIYFSPFVAGEMKLVGQRLGTDGDMAAVNILAHEWGHAMQQILGLSGGATKPQEQQADCFAGGFARYALRQGYIENGDIEEAELGLALVGGVMSDHGSPKERQNAFSRGLENGLGSCRF